MISKRQLGKTIHKYIYSRNRVHYLKWNLKNHWSIRFFFHFQNRQEYNLKWVLKNHISKRYIILDRKEALDYIQHFSLAPEEPIECFSLNEYGKGYRRLVVYPRKGTDCYIETKIQGKEGIN